MTVPKKFLFQSGGYYITDAGYDTNGNWSYCVRPLNKKRAQRIQHGDLNANGQHLPKITHHDFPLMPHNIHKSYMGTMQAIIDYYRKYYEK